MNYKTALQSVGVSNSVDPDQGRRSVGLGLDPDYLHVNSLNISEEMLDAPQENFVVFTTLLYMLMCRHIFNAE